MPATNALTKTEQGELAELESVIERGLETFVEVGNALLVIRDRRLYRQEFDSFDAYCQSRWSFTRQRASQLIEAARVVGEVSTIVSKSALPTPKTPLPASESQAREVAKAPPGERAAAWKEAVETAPRNGNGQPHVTAAHVRETVNRRAAAVPDATPQTQRVTTKRREPESSPAEGDGIEDAVEAAFNPPEPAPPFAEFNAGVKRYIGKLNEAKSEIRTACEAKGQEFHSPYARSLMHMTTIGDINRLIRDAEDAIVVRVEKGNRVVNAGDVRVGRAKP